MKAYLQNISSNLTFLTHSILFYITLAMLPLAWIAFSFFTETQKLEEFEECLESFQERKRTIQHLQSKEKTFYETLEKSDPTYIEKNFEKLSFEDGSILFKEEEFRSLEKIEEIEKKLVKPLRIDRNDLLYVLSLLDQIPLPLFSPPEKAPQIIVQDFILIRNPHENDDETYELNLRFVQRQKKSHL